MCLVFVFFYMFWFSQSLFVFFVRVLFFHFFAFLFCVFFCVFCLCFFLHFSFFLCFCFFLFSPRPPFRGRGRPLLGLSVAASSGGGRPLSLLPLAALIVLCGVCGCGWGWCCWWCWFVLLVLRSCWSCACLVVLCLFGWCWVCCGVWLRCFAIRLPRFRCGRPLSRFFLAQGEVHQLSKRSCFRACMCRRGRQHTRAWLLMGVASAGPATWACCFFVVALRGRAAEVRCWLPVRSPVPPRYVQRQDS